MVGKGGTAGFLGKAYDPYTLYPDGDDMDMAKMDRIKVDDLQLRPEVFALRLRAPGQAPRCLERGHAARSTRPWPTSSSTSTTTGLSRLIVSGRAREAFNLQAESPQTRDLYGRNTFGQSCLLARRLVEAGTKVVEVVWPKVANSDNHSWDHHVDLTNRMRDRSGPMLDQGLSGLLTDMDQRGLARRHAGRRGRRVRPQSAEGRQHLGQRQQRRRPRSLAVLLHGGRRRRRHPPRPHPRPVRQDRLRPAVRSRSIPASCWPRSTTPSASIRPRSSTTT